MKTQLKIFSFIILIALTVALATAQAVKADSCTVTSDADSGEGTLRALLTDPTCTTIDFGGDYTIRPVRTLILSRDVTIDGAGHDVILSGDTDSDSSGEILIMEVSQGVTAAISNLTLEKGYGDDDSSAIRNIGTLTVANSLITGNTGESAIKNYYVLTVMGSEFTDNTNGGAGAAIHSRIGYSLEGPARLTVNQSTFTNNQSISGVGGAIFSDGLMTLTDSTFEGNTAPYGGGAVYIDGNDSTSVTGSTFSGNQTTGGGAIFTRAPLVVSDSIFSGNAADDGGAIFNEGAALSVTGSTFSDNTAHFYGGGILSGGTATVTNSTFAGNQITGGSDAEGSAIFTWGALTVNNNTFYYNLGSGTRGTISSHDVGWGYNTGSITVNNSLFFGYLPKSCTYGNDSHSGSHNFGNASGCDGMTVYTDSLLGSLVDYGDFHQAVALLPGSPAIDAGDSAYCPATDQRGVARPQGAGCDVGAFESQGFTLTASSGNNQTALLGDEFLSPLEITVSSNQNEPVNGGFVTFTPPASGASATLISVSAQFIDGKASVLATANQIVGSYQVTASTAGAQDLQFDLANTDQCLMTQIVTSNADIGPGTLRNAIAFACSGGTITFSGDYAGDNTIRLDSNLVVPRSMTIDGGTNTVIISGDNASDSIGAADQDGYGDTRLITVINSVTLNLNHLTLEKGYAHSIYSFDDWRFKLEDTYGGAIYVPAGALNVTDSTFANNESSNGGAININGNLTVTGSTFNSNEGFAGGAISVSGMATVTNSTFVGNVSSWGGAINSGGVITVANSTFSENEASHEGGALYNDRGSMTVTNSLFKGNTGGTCGFYENETHSGSYNLADDVTCGDGFSQSSNILIGSLGYYGGNTQTIPLLPGSAAIDAGDDANCPATDQRGVARPQGAHCDIGAYEYNPPPPEVTKTLMMPEPSLAGYPIIRTYVYFAGQGVQSDYACTVDYGDGTVQTGRVEDRSGGQFICSDEITTNHVYQNAGTYTLTFRIRNVISGAEIAPTIQHEVIADPDPGYITWTPKPVVENQPVTFSTSQTADQYVWYLVSGPGIVGPTPIGMDQSLEFTFSSSGTYKVMLVLMDIDPNTQTLTGIADGAEVEVIPLASAPTLNSISPASAMAGSGDLTLTVTGSDFTSSSKVRWNGTDLATTFIGDTQLSAVVPASHLASVQTAQVAVYTPAPGGGTSSVLAFFVTQASAGVTGQEVASGTDPSADFGPATAAATGDGLLVVAQYDANPGGTPSFTANSAYFDVYAAPSNTFSQVSIVACGMNPNDRLFWWDIGQGKWLKASPQSYDQGSGCITLTVTESSSPSLNQLQGTIFAVGIEPNAAPTAHPGGPYLGAINTAILFDGRGSSDPENDPLSYAWTFSDGSTGTDAQPSHSYAAAGIYDVCLTVNDGSLDSVQVCTIVVVYDPNGGFVTGGGWIMSPAGAYIPDPGLSGKATFGFVSKYQKGASIPTGNTEFQFQAGSFNFHSTSYDWLVVNKAGNTAQFKGSGAVNGALDPNGNAYKFQLWANDGAPDTFRIKIWWEAAGVENVIYDNGFNQAIGGGSIIVQSGK